MISFFVLVGVLFYYAPTWLILLWLAVELTGWILKRK